MSLLNLFGRRKSASVARERLQILLAHERNSDTNSDLIAMLHKDVLQAVAKHLSIDPDKVSVKMHRETGMSLLEIDIEIESPAKRVAGSSMMEDDIGRLAAADG